MSRTKISSLACCLPFLSGVAPAAAKPANAARSYGQQAAEVTAFLHEKFWDEGTSRYRAAIDSKEPDRLWGAGVMFSALAGASRHDPRYVPIMKKFFGGLEGYWDSKVKVPGFEPTPTPGNGNDKYYDDNAWMVITYLEAYEVTGESLYLERSRQTLRFVMSGWDEQAGGGIWWHERHAEDSKNTCVNAPAAVGCLRLAKFSDPKTAEQLLGDATKLIDWTTTTLRAPNGLFGDSIKVSTGQISRGQLTYNNGLMLRAYLGMHSWLRRPTYLQQARSMAKAAEELIDPQTGAYRDPLKWSHLMVEADIELYRRSGDQFLLKRAKKDTDFNYTKWKADPPKDLITNASLARQLWLLADLETSAGKAFWEKSDRVAK